MFTAHDIARFFIERASAEADESDLSNLKLQKLCYYAQGFALAITGRPLFGEDLEAWREGPVVRDIYRTYRQFGSRVITEAQAGVPITDEATVELLEAVYGHYGQFSPWALRNKTHQEPPWREARPTESALRQETMATFFRTQLRLLDDPVEAEREMLAALLKGHQGLVEGTRRGRADIAAGRYRPLSAYS